MTKFLPLAAVLTTACYEKAPPAGAGLNNTAPSIGVNTIDNDGDQFSEADGDCDDTDATVFPGAFELATRSTTTVTARSTTTSMPPSACSSTPMETAMARRHRRLTVPVRLRALRSREGRCGHQ